MKYIILGVLLLTGLAATAQEPVLSGRVTDLQTGAPLAGATVLAGDTIVITNGNGLFHLASRPASDSLTISFTGYRTQVIELSDQDKKLNIQMEPNTHALNEVRVTAFGNNETVKETAGAVAVLSGSQLNQGSGISMQAALNSVPGVRMDQSNLEDSRISIRGNGIRSPWGIRKVKIYVNNIPLTEADGTSRIEALDVTDLGQATIIKGPASSIYGGGTGGVIKFKLKRSPYREQSLEASGLMGSYGLNRYALTYRKGGDKFNSFVSYRRQTSAGYREHSSDKRRFIAGNFQLFPSDKRMVTIIVSYTAQDAQIPGALTREQMAQNPKQANATYLDKDAGRHQKWIRIGIGQKYSFNNHFSNSTSVFTYFYNLYHPLPFAIIRNYYQSYGGRTKFDYDPGFKTLPTTFTFGGEFNQGYSKGTQYVNNHGVGGAISGNTDYKNTLFSLFLQTETKIWNFATLELGLSYNGTNYNATDYLHPSQGGIKKFKPQVSPRIALSHNFGIWLSLHGSVSTGFSPPTTTQIQNKDRSINKTLQAEKGINYEIDAKGNLLKSRLSYNLALFRMDMKGELIAQSISPGLTVYHNAGKTTHNGVELSLSYQAIKKGDDKTISTLRPYLAITYSDFKFKDYKILNADNHVIASYGGNELTGIAPWVISAGVNLETKIGIYGNAHYLYNDRLPLNDKNTDYNPAYNVLNAKVGYQKRLSKYFGLNIYVGVNNITDSKYSSFTEINAPSYGWNPPAYFNPSLPRNGYAGLNVKYYFK